MLYSVGFFFASLSRAGIYLNGNVYSMLFVFVDTVMIPCMKPLLKSVSECLYLLVIVSVMLLVWMPVANLRPRLRASCSVVVSFLFEIF